mmetsp:Transcript_46689/g.78365  ORF Transcript_46689/g.78365 Transcript_46689/m.78365 type:complete len:210 (-) Transcript_46689:1147-1776(-)
MLNGDARAGITFVGSLISGWRWGCNGHRTLTLCPNLSLRPTVTNYDLHLVPVYHLDAPVAMLHEDGLIRAEESLVLPTTEVTVVIWAQTDDFPPIVLHGCYRLNPMSGCKRGLEIDQLLNWFIRVKSISCVLEIDRQESPDASRRWEDCICEPECQRIILVLLIRRITGNDEFHGIFIDLSILAQSPFFEECLQMLCSQQHCRQCPNLC